MYVKKYFPGEVVNVFRGMINADCVLNFKLTKLIEHRGKLLFFNHHLIWSFQPSDTEASQKCN